MPRSVALTAYRGATALLEFAAPAFLRWRLRSGKEDASRLAERLARGTRPRPAGSLAWLHGASLGEGLALLPLIEALVARGFGVLVTTGTVTSSRVLMARLPAGAFHQFAPLDGPRAARRFLGQWRPDLIGFAESDLWPNLLAEARRRRIPTALVNARMSARSFARWQHLPSLIGPLLAGFDVVLAQTEADRHRFQTLGAVSAAVGGNLKFDVDPPPADPDRLAALRAAIGTRPVWVAASTQAGEDEGCCGVHAALKSRLPSLLTIIVPRKVDRAATIKARCGNLGLSTKLRSMDEPIGADTDLYVADTVGEVGLFYRLATVVFVGKSLPEGGGGQNPIEPAKLGNAILHGPHTANFAEVYATLDRSGGGVRVEDEAGLATALHRLLSSPAEAETIALKARWAVDDLRGATARTMAALEPFLADAEPRPSP